MCINQNALMFGEGKKNFLICEIDSFITAHVNGKELTAFLR